MISSRYRTPWREEGPACDNQNDKEGRKIMGAIVTAFLLVLALALFITWLIVTDDQRRITNKIEELDTEHGGSWFYDPNDGFYKDFMTDRKIKG